MQRNRTADSAAFIWYPFYFAGAFGPTCIVAIAKGLDYALLIANGNFRCHA
jgi:hypothetical protein